MTCRCEAVPPMAGGEGAGWYLRSECVPIWIPNRFADLRIRNAPVNAIRQNPRIAHRARRVHTVYTAVLIIRQIGPKCTTFHTEPATKLHGRYPWAPPPPPPPPGPTPPSRRAMGYGVPGRNSCLAPARQKVNKNIG